MRRTILIVDDNPPIRTVLRWIITSQSDWQVCGEASNGAEAVSIAAKLKPDIIVLDFSMPIMNGVDAAVRIKRLVPEAHLLMFTSYAGETIEEAARSVGVEAFVEKGDRTKLLETIHRIESPTEKCQSVP